MMSKWRVHVAPRWAPVRCDEVRALDIQAWLDGKTEKPAQDSLAMLRQILDFATLYEVIPVNVARRPYRIPTAHEDRSDGAFTLAELDRIATAARGLYCEAAILLMCFGSCRVGESLAVRVGEVSRVSSHGLDLTTASIVRQMNSDATLSEDGRLKNRQSVRAVVVPPPWGDRLWGLAEAAQGAGDAWLCDGGHGRPASQYNLRNDWRRAVVAAGLPYRQPRAARRSWETYMRWEMGVEQSRIEQMMGHALPGVTGAHYDRPSSQAFVDVVAEAFARKPFRST